jgi:hypothetical protein
VSIPFGRLSKGEQILTMVNDQCARRVHGPAWQSAAAAIFAVTVLSNSGAASAQDKQEYVALDYEVRLNGILVADLQVDARVGSQTYDLRSTMQTRGLMDVILGFRSRAKAEGRIISAAKGPLIRPDNHSDNTIWMSEERRVNITYGADAPTQTVVVPHPSDEDRDEVSLSLRENTQDLLSAALQLSLRAAGDNACQSTGRVFDGRRRYNLALKVGAVENTALGSDIHCDGKLDRLAGRSAEPWLPRSEAPNDFQLWFSRVDPSLPPVPFRLRAFSGIGWAVAQLTRHSRAPRIRHIERTDTVFKDE